MKVTQTKLYNGVPVAEGRLVLVKTNLEDLNSSSGVLLTDGEFYNPIIISETEKLEEGDWAYGKYHNEIFKFGTYRGVAGRNFKILVLPEQFSSEHLQAIISGKMKDGDKVLVECETKSLPMDYHGVDSRGDYRYYCPKCGKGGSYMGTGGVSCFNQECIEYQVKLTQGHVIFHKEEEKMVPVSVAKAAFLAGNEHAPLEGQTEVDQYFNRWFEQSI